MEENNSLKNALAIDLIGDKILSYLSFEDMQMASLAFRGLHQMVRNSQRFSNTTALCLTNRKFKVINDNKLEELHLSSWSWGTVKFDMISEIVKFVENNEEILGNIRSLRLTGWGNWSRFTMTRNPDYERSKFLQKIFENCHNIVELKIDLELLMKKDFSALEFGEKIKSLEIFSCFSYDYENWEDSLAIQNLQQISTAFQMKLQDIKISLHRGYQNLNAGIVNIISNNWETLQSLNFDPDQTPGLYWDLDLTAMKNIEIPNLKKFHANVEGGQEAEVVQFLQNLSTLESLTLDFRFGCPMMFLDYLQQNAGSLRTLDLAAEDFEILLDWKFLENCSKLQEFSVIQRIYSAHDNTRATGVSFLKWLPPSVTKLCLGGLNHFWRDQNACNISEFKIIALLSRFPAMTEIDLTECRDEAVTDLVVQTIIAKMTKLKVFKFGHGFCTDASISGIGEEFPKGGVSLTKLTGLTHLVIKSCPGISTAGLLNSVKHSSLRSLEYRHCNKLTTEEVEQLVSQNPFLSSLSIPVDRCIKELELETKLKMSRYWKKLKLIGPNSHEWYIKDYYDNSSDD